MTTAKPRVYEFTYLHGTTSQRFRVVVDRFGLALEQYDGKDRLGVERWLASSHLDGVAGACVRAVTGGKLDAQEETELERLRALVAESIDTFERSAGLAYDELDDAGGHRDDAWVRGRWTGRGEAFAEAARVLRGDSAKPSESARWRDAPSLWEAPDRSRFQCARCARVVSADFGRGCEFEGLCGRCWCVVSGEASQPVADPHAATGAGQREPKCDDCGGTGGQYGQVDERAPDCDACDGAGTSPNPRQASESAPRDHTSHDDLTVEPHIHLRRHDCGGIEADEQGRRDLAGAKAVLDFLDRDYQSARDAASERARASYDDTIAAIWRAREVVEAAIRREQEWATERLSEQVKS